MNHDVMWGVVSVAFAAVSLVPYFISTLRGRTKPHVFTWVIWTLLTAMAFMVQFKSGAGPGAWATAFSAVSCIFILLASFRYGEKIITRSDWATFLAALGYYPTCRKSWHKPFEEMWQSHGLSAIKHILSLLALSTWSIATAFYPAGLVLMNLILISIILVRRRALTLGRNPADESLS